MTKSMTIAAYLKAIAKAEARARERIATAIVAEQSRLLDAGEAPQGGSQKANAPKYAQRKGGKPPLVRDGVLRTASRWRIEVKRGRIEIRPPVERSEACYVLSAKGFRTLLDGITSKLRKDAQQIVDEELARVTQ
jgi:hypothetical protein